jgi:hypothetical protein
MPSRPPTSAQPTTVAYVFGDTIEPVRVIAWRRGLPVALFDDGTARVVELHRLRWPVPHRRTAA